MAGGYFFLSPRSAIVLIIYMILVYTVVGVFNVATTSSSNYDKFSIDYSMAEDVKTAHNLTTPSAVIKENMSVFDWIFTVIGVAQTEAQKNPVGQFAKGIGDFFASIGAFFSMLFGFLTFNLVGSSPLLLSLPSYVAWIPFLMVLPVWILIMFWITPLAIEVLKAIADAITPLT